MYFLSLTVEWIVKANVTFTRLLFKAESVLIRPPWFIEQWFIQVWPLSKLGPRLEKGGNSPQGKH